VQLTLIQKKNENTAYAATSGAKSVNYLDRQNVNCPSGYVLNSFNLNRNPKDMSQVRYSFTCVKAQTLCCTKYSSSKTDMGNRSIFYLDRQQTGFLNSMQTVLKGFHLKSKYSPDQIWYDFEMCKLKDMDAAKALEQAEQNVTNLKNQLNSAEQNVKTTQDVVDKLAAQLKALQEQLQQATNANKAAQAAVQAMNTQINNAQTSLTSAKANPGLVC